MVIVIDGPSGRRIRQANHVLQGGNNGQLDTRTCHLRKRRKQHITRKILLSIALRHLPFKAAFTLITEKTEDLTLACLQANQPSCASGSPMPTAVLSFWPKLLHFLKEVSMLDLCPLDG
ncbi:hypothetical protein CEXT_798661 [Caerostris extrusa]|uniref:Uncharacterized protein n=1 Tax=Caerostris extrusa TaxID=172846 RepID=A0AAV4RDB4_CAEEX|nr:hypothetical protein CEXT_798661 [Caerostris extrusa]